ncbi:MAG: hypothetical protein Q9184_006694 [Pyrenodesmia sp. 2 TL-2023]
MPSRNQRLQRYERGWSTDSEASQEEEDRHNEELSPTSRFQEEMARSSRGSQNQYSTQRIVYHMPPTQLPALVQVATLAATPTSPPASPLASTPAETPAPATAAPLAIMPAVAPALAMAELVSTVPAATSAPTAITNAVATPAPVPAPLNASVEHPAQTSRVSGSTTRNGGSSVRVAPWVKTLLKRLRVLAGLGGLLIIGVSTYNSYYFPQSQALAGFRTPSGDLAIHETRYGADLLSDLRLLVFNSSHDQRDNLLEHIYTARVNNSRAHDSAETFHRQSLEWFSYISGLQQELTSIERTADNQMLKVQDTIRFLAMPGNPKPHSLFKSSEAPAKAVRRRILKEQKNLLNSFEKINSSAVQYREDVAFWKQSVKRVDAAIGPVKRSYAYQKIKIAKKFTTKHQVEARLEQARRTDEHIMQLQEADNLTCRTMKHVDRVEQGSKYALSKLQDVQRFLTELILDCSTGEVCYTFPDQLKLLGANDEEVAKYWEEKGDKICRKDEEVWDVNDGYLACVVM